MFELNLKRLITLGLVGSSLMLSAVTVKAESTDKTDDNDKQWQLAKKAGYTQSQFDQIMSIPTIQGLTETPDQQKMRSTVSMTDEQAKVVKTAQQQLGIPYVWGGASPSQGFDCSGLVQYVYKTAVNYTMPRVTTDQQNQGQRVDYDGIQDVDNLKPGDVVFYGYPSSYHTAIYVGNGQIIQSPKPGEVVQQINMSYFVPNHARRVLTNTTSKPTAHKINEYKVVSTKSGTVWKNLDLTQKKANVSTYYDQVIRCKYYYNVNGKKVYSAYNYNDEWLGYFEEGALTAAKNRGGNYHSYGKYVSVTKDHYTLWKDLDFKDKKGVSSSYYHQTLLAKGYYDHFNGSRYYSLYTKDNKWVGYIHSGGVKNSSVNGSHYDESGYVTIPNTTGQFYQNVELTKVRSSYQKWVNKTVQVKGMYSRFDGVVVYSLYDKDNNWVGYMNQAQLAKTTNPGGQYHSFGKQVEVVKDNYTIWGDFNFKKNKGKSKPWYKKTVTAKGYYYHFNGSKYYSLQDENGRWIGYINANGVKLK